MVLDSKFQQLRDHFQIVRPEDWQQVSPASVVALDGIGEATLNHLRLHLAARGLTLRDDRTPAYWQQHLEVASVGSQIAETDTAAICPFTILIDTGEQHPFSFQGMKTDANQGNRPLIVRTERTALGPTWGDYTIAELRGQVHVERKSQSDAQSTIHGWGDRRENFQETLANLAMLPSSAVIVECSLGELIKTAGSRGKKSAAENSKILFRQVLAWQDDFRVPWIFCDSRRLAEVATYRWLHRYWKYRMAEQKQTERAARESAAELDAVV